MSHVSFIYIIFNASNGVWPAYSLYTSLSQMAKHVGRDLNVLKWKTTFLDWAVKNDRRPSDRKGALIKINKRSHSQSICWLHRVLYIHTFVMYAGDRTFLKRLTAPARTAGTYVDINVAFVIQETAFTMKLNLDAYSSPSSLSATQRLIIADFYHVCHSAVNFC